MADFFSLLGLVGFTLAMFGLIWVMDRT